MGNKFSANAPALGYLYQCRYALFHLLKNDNQGFEISIEKLDDISFEEEGEAKELIQTKHHIRSKGSLSNASTDLWKTMRVWCENYLENNIKLEDINFTLVTNSKASEDSAASMLRPNDERKVEKALEILRETVENSTNESNRKAYDSFMELNKKEQRSLIRNIYILDNSSDIIDVKDSILKELRYVAKPKHLDSFFNRLESWWNSKVINHLMNDSLTVISYDELRYKIDNIREQFKADNLPVDFPEPLDVNKEDLDEKERIFLEQLELIMVSHPRIKKAISDYYRAFRQRSKWIREDLLMTDELEEYESKLIDEWERKFYMMKEDMSYDDITEREKQNEGRALYNWMIEKAEINIKPNFTKAYVMRGSYHILANDLKVGWHIDFIERFKHLFKEVSA